MSITIKFLGTGTSHGVPKINCRCDICLSNDPKNKRLRSSILIEHSGRNILFDTSADFRQQALKFNLDRLDYIFFTHAHADHTHGIDDIRAYQTKMSPPIDCYAIKSVCDDFRERFGYIFLDKMPVGGGTPRINLISVNFFEPVNLNGLDVTALKVIHGEKETAGYKIGNIAYIPDVKQIPDETMPFLYKLDCLIIDALRYRPHSTHLCLEETLEIVRKLKPAHAYLTHIDHEIEHNTAETEIKGRAKIAFDGLVIKV